MFKFIIFSIVFASVLFSQPLKIGGNTAVGISHKNQEFLFCAELNLIYELNDNLELRTALGGMITSLEGRLGTYSGGIINIGISLIYYPFEGDSKPFLGGGMVYNNNLFSPGGNEPYGKSYMNNAVGYKLILGLQNKLKDYLNLEIGINYNYQNPRVRYVPYSTEQTQKHEFNYEISSLNLFIAFIFIL